MPFEATGGTAMRTVTCSASDGAACGPAADSAWGRDAPQKVQNLLSAGIDWRQAGQITDCAARADPSEAAAGELWASSGPPQYVQAVAPSGLTVPQEEQR